MLQPVEPILVVDLFRIERASLLELLTSLDHGRWEAPTVCTGWTVRDIAAHLVADDLGRLSRSRDGHVTGPQTDRANLVTLVNAQNDAWVIAMRRISPRVLLTLLEIGGRETLEHFESLDPFEIDGPVWWATGDEPAPVWLDLARELTERWHHQQQIRDAVGAPSLDDPSLMGPMLGTFAHALPRTFRDVDLPEGAAIELAVAGESGRTWSIVRTRDEWLLREGRAAAPHATVEIGQEDFWRLVTKGITPEVAERRARLSGDIGMARRVLTSVAIIG
jgi:uncharacterized protein (TIGR03083 family)